MKRKYIGILLGIMLTLHCNAGRNWDFKTRYLGMRVNDRGYIVSLKNIMVKPAPEFSPADKPSPLLSLYDSRKKV